MFSLRKSDVAQPSWVTHIGGLDYQMNSETHDIISCIWKMANIRQMILFVESEILLLSARQVLVVLSVKSNIST